MPKPYTRGLIMNRPAGGMSFHGRLFQANMWRNYALTIKYDRPCRRFQVGRRWLLEIGRHTYEECIRRAKVNLYLAKRSRRSPK
jgi:hypothetical protein